MTVNEAKRQYFAHYREQNRDKLREYRRTWYKTHKQNVKLYAQRYWDKKAKDMESSRSP